MKKNIVYIEKKSTEHQIRTVAKKIPKTSHTYVNPGTPFLIIDSRRVPNLFDPLYVSQRRISRLGDIPSQIGQIKMLIPSLFLEWGTGALSHSRGGGVTSQT